MNYVKLFEEYFSEPTISKIPEFDSPYATSLILRKADENEIARFLDYIHDKEVTFYDTEGNECVEVVDEIEYVGSEQHYDRQEIYINDTRVDTSKPITVNV